MHNGKRDDIKVQLITRVNNVPEVSIQLNLTNNSPNDYWVTKDVIFMDGFKAKTFRIDGPSEIRCRFHTGKYPASDMMLVKSSAEAIGPELLLSNVCMFQDAKSGVYILKVDASSILYTSEQYELYQNAMTPSNPIEYFIEKIESPIALGGSINDESINDIDKIWKVWYSNLRELRT